MKIKKILSVILSASVAAALSASPVLAGYTAADYDIVNTTLTFDDGTATNAIDNTAALLTEDDEVRVFDTTMDTTAGFFLSFDFCMNSDAGLIQVPKYKSSGIDKVGPRLKIADGVLVTETGSSSTQSLGTCEVGAWYTAEIEGRTGLGSEYTTFRLYDSTGALIQETSNFNMRNISSESRSFTGMAANNASIDNVLLVEEYPDVLTLTADSSSLNAGQSLMFGYEMTRAGSDNIKQHDIDAWVVYDADGNAITDGSVSVSDGILSAAIDAETQNVTVKASVTFGEKTLTGEADITINAVDTTEEIFDTIVISGADSVKAGTSSVYTVTASKNGTDVTDKLTSDNVAWSLYDSDNINEYSNVNVSIENGTLTIADGVIPHALTIRAASTSGVVYGAKAVSIEWSDSQTESVIYYNAYESDVAASAKAVSVDGSVAQYVSTTSCIWQGSANNSEYTVTECDIKFAAEGAGIILMRRDGQKTNTQITYSSGVLKTYGETVLTGADNDTWYHLEILYSSEKANASCNIYAYDSDGNLSEPVTTLDINRRNGEAYAYITANAGTYIDNLKVYTPISDSLSVSGSAQYMFAGETAQFTASAARNGLTLLDYSGLSWKVLDEEGLQIIDGTVTIDDNGLLTADTSASAQTVTVQAATSDGSITAAATITIQVSDVFEITNIGINEDATKIVMIYANKNFYYSDEVTFIIAIYGDTGALKGIAIKSGYGDAYSLGENEISIDFDLPDDFDSENDTIAAFVWTMV